jgi:hypothetical protein
MAIVSSNLNVTNANVETNGWNATQIISDNKQIFLFGRNLTINGGTTWTLLPNITYSTTMSNDGTYIYYVCTSGSGVNLFQSTNSGQNFTQLTGASINLGNGFPANQDRAFRAVHTSVTGLTVAAYCSATLALGGGIYVSQNYGSSWSLVNTSYIGINSGYISITDTGYVYGFTSGSAYLYQSTNFGSTFTNKGTFNSISNAFRPSPDGTRIIWGGQTNSSGINYSTNGLTNISYFGLPGGLRGACGIPNRENTSIVTWGYNSNYGSINTIPVTKISNSFKTITFLGPSQFNKNGMMSPQSQSNCTSMSSTGQYILMGINNNNNYNILTMSNNYGVSWTALNWNNPDGGWPLSTVANSYPSCAYNWSSTCMSSNGEIMIACSSSSTAYVFLSTNYGAYFTIISGPGNTKGLSTSIVNSWSFCSMSGDGNIILLTNGLALYLSTNKATSFTQLTTTNGLPTTVSWNYCVLGYTSTSYMLASGSGTSGGLYLTTNSGTNWSKIDGTTNVIGLPTTSAAYSSLSISNNGSTMLAVQSGQGVFYSTNYGSSWTRFDSASNTLGLPTGTSAGISGMSGDGTKILTNINSILYLSTDSGASFRQINSTTVVNGLSQVATSGWGQLAISNNGQQFYVGNGGVMFCYDGSANYWCTINRRDTYIGIYTGFGSLPINGTYVCVKFSGDGTKVIGALSGAASIGSCSLTISYDGGYTFNYIANRGQMSGTGNFTIAWQSGCISQTGQYMLLCQTNGVYLTTNYGLIWLCIAGSLAPTAAISTGLPTTTQTWSCSAMSSTGIVSILGITAGALYLSTNSFATYSIISGTSSQFTSNGLPVTNQNWNNVQCSYDGSVILASITSGALYLSTNTGSSWTILGGATNSYGFPATATSWSSLSISGTNGQYMLVSVNTGGLYLSTNTGTSWTQISGTTNSYGLPSLANAWTCSAISQDGLIMCAAINGANLYYSTNSGTTWSTYNYSYKCASQNFPWYSLSMTADGSKVFATLSGADYFIITFTKQY